MIASPEGSTPWTLPSGAAASAITRVKIPVPQPTSST
jgi:hypothetical protein